MRTLLTRNMNARNLDDSCISTIFVVEQAVETTYERVWVHEAHSRKMKCGKKVLDLR